MALARLALRNLQQKVASYSSPPLILSRYQRCGNELLRGFATSTSEAKEKSERGSSEVAVSSSSEGRKSRLFPRRRGARRSLSWPWRRSNDTEFVPDLYEFFPSGLGNALMQATENINRLFDNMDITPWSLSGQIRAKDYHYKLRYEMPGISKDDVKITIDDGVLTIKGEHKEEKEEQGDDDGGEYWSSSSYGYYNTSLVLPEDAKSDEIKAELKDGVLIVTIPRVEKPKKDVKQVTVN